MRLTPNPPPGRVAPAQPPKPVGATARLIADLAASPPPAAVADTPETRSERLVHEPTGLFALLHGKMILGGPAPDGRQAHIRSRIVAALFAPARQAYAESVEDGAATSRDRVRVLRDLGPSAPAVTAFAVPPPASAAPFTPSPEDVAQSIDGGKPQPPPFSAFRDFANWTPIRIETVNGLPVLALISALATAFVVWLLL